jgi:hypothetical protein
VEWEVEEDVVEVVMVEGWVGGEGVRGKLMKDGDVRWRMGHDMML